MSEPIGDSVAEFVEALISEGRIHQDPNKWVSKRTARLAYIEWYKTKHTPTEPLNMTKREFNTQFTARVRIHFPIEESVRKDGGRNVRAWSGLVMVSDPTIPTTTEPAPTPSSTPPTDPPNDHATAPSPPDAAPSTPQEPESPPDGPDPYWDEAIPDPDDAKDGFGLVITRRNLYYRTKEREESAKTAQEPTVAGSSPAEGSSAHPAADLPDKAKKPPKGKEWLEDWEIYVPVLAKLPLNSQAHERECVLRFLMRDPVEARYKTTPISGETLFEWHTESLSKDEVALLLGMPRELAEAFYIHLTHGVHGTGLEPATSFEIGTI